MAKKNPGSVAGTVSAEQIGVSADGAPVAPDVAIALSFASDDYGDEQFADKRTDELEKIPFEDRKYVLKVVRVDKFNTLRKRVLLTPAVCKYCGEDLLELRGITNSYFSLSELEQKQIKVALEQHQHAAHSMAELQVLSAKDMPTSWSASDRSKPLSAKKR